MPRGGWRSVRGSPAQLREDMHWKACIEMLVHAIANPSAFCTWREPLAITFCESLWCTMQIAVVLKRTCTRGGWRSMRTVLTAQLLSAEGLSMVSSRRQPAHAPIDMIFPDF